VSSALSGPLDARGRECLESGIGQLAVVLPLMTEEHGVVYFRRLQRLAQLVSALDV
jgi:hypothetical protein